MKSKRALVVVCLLLGLATALAADSTVLLNGAGATFHALSPYDDWHRQAWAAGLVLLGMVLVANIGTRLALGRGGAARGV